MLNMKLNSSNKKETCLTQEHVFFYFLIALQVYADSMTPSLNCLIRKRAISEMILNFTSVFHLVS